MNATESLPIPSELAVGRAGCAARSRVHLAPTAGRMRERTSGACSLLERKGMSHDLTPGISCSTADGPGADTYTCSATTPGPSLGSTDQPTAANRIPCKGGGDGRLIGVAQGHISIVPAMDVLSCMAERTPRMSSEARLSTELVDHIEEIRYQWALAMADTVISPEEAATMSRSLEVLETKGTELDLGVAATIACLRRGPGSQRAQRLSSQLANFQARLPEAG